MFLVSPCRRLEVASPNKSETGAKTEANKRPELEDTVQFEHKFFSSFEDLYFRLTDDQEPVAVVKLAKSNEAILGFDGIRREFGIKPDTHDDEMLNQIANALQYVSGLRLGDEFPKEVYSGEASWDPSERHFMIAKQRLTMQLVTWMTGNEHIFTTAEELLMMAEDPQLKKNISLAFDEAAHELGLGRDQREQVVGQIEALAKELAYIEAMRDTFGEIKKIDEKIQGLRRLFSVDRTMIDTVDQVARLSQRCVKSYADIFEQVDAQTGEVMAMLKNITNQLTYIHKVRDDLYRRMRPWEEFIRTWKMVFVQRSDDNIFRIREIYQYLAPRYMKVNDWVLMSKLNSEKKKPLGGVLRW